MCTCVLLLDVVLHFHRRTSVAISTELTLLSKRLRLLVLTTGTTNTTGIILVANSCAV
jgi:hypothetical protein